MNAHKSSTNPPRFTPPAAFRTHPTQKERYAVGKTLRDRTPRQNHAVWKPSRDRPDPVALMEQSNVGRIADLVPIRHGRMLQSPFTFFRGAALNMAADLSTTPSSGLRVQACGDCHLYNFGAFATPERRVIFDINDLDETLPAPWEWDVKRLTASFVLACRSNGFSEADARDAVLKCVRSYRKRMADCCEMSSLEIWYASIEVEKLIPTFKDAAIRKRIERRLTKARERSVLEHEFPELVTTVGAAPAIRDNPPLIYHWRDGGNTDDEHYANVERAFARYRETMQEERRLLLDRYKVMDFALKVVGVGSVGTYCAVMLLMASEHDPLFLQVKQARPSVLELYAGKSVHANDGQRIVYGCRVMQSASDIFLGWTQSDFGRQFYVRQLKDMKIKPLVETYTPSVMNQYAEICAQALAHAHARSGEPNEISGYLGRSDKFDQAIADFAIAYADQTERDHAVVTKAARAGRLKVVIEKQ